jgi:hypothetical protein
VTTEAFDLLAHSESTIVLYEGPAQDVEPLPPGRRPSRPSADETSEALLIATGPDGLKVAPARDPGRSFMLNLSDVRGYKFTRRARGALDGLVIGVATGATLGGLEGYREGRYARTGAVLGGVVGGLIGLPFGSIVGHTDHFVF